MHLSLVIPAFNEADRLPATLDAVLPYLEGQPFESEVIVVDDGSTDTTSEVVRSRYPRVRLISFDVNRGKGHAVREGMLTAAGDYRVYYDADGSTPIAELEKLWPLFENGADIVMGSRSLEGARVEVRQSWRRETMGRIFNKFVRLFAVRGFPDTQCGFKGFEARAATQIFSRQRIDGFSFDAELLLIARRHGFEIEQTPIRWINSSRSHVRMIRDSAHMLVDLLVIRWNALLGRYD